MDALRKTISELIATFFYVGHSPKAPGTCGSLAALPFAWWLWKLPALHGLAIFILVLVIGIWASSEVVRKSGVDDNQKIVIDEVLGIFITTTVAQSTWWSYGLAFALFRLFDIWKPGPVGYADRNIKGGLGVVVDDLIAGVLAAASLAIIQLFLTRAFL